MPKTKPRPPARSPEQIEQDLACPACGNRVRTTAPDEWWTLHKRICLNRTQLGPKSTPIRIERKVS